MSLYELLDVESVEVELKSATKEEAMSEMVDILYDAGKIKNREKVLDALWERERMESTGLEHGIAVPHCKTGAVDRLVAALGISKRGIDFECHDGKPAKIIFALIAEPNNPGPHVRALKRLAELLSHAEVRETLINARTAEELLSIIKEKEIEK